LLEVLHPNPSICSSNLDKLKIDLGEKRGGGVEKFPPMAPPLIECPIRNNTVF